MLSPYFLLVCLPRKTKFLCRNEQNDAACKARIQQYRKKWEQIVSAGQYKWVGVPDKYKMLGDALQHEAKRNHFRKVKILLELMEIHRIKKEKVPDFSELLRTTISFSHRGEC